MSRCPTFTFQVSIISKLLGKHICTIVSFKITIRKYMFTLTFVDLENETSISIWVFEKMNVLKKLFLLFSTRYTIKLTEEKWNKFINELWNINLYMNIRVTNWHIWSNDPRKMNFLTSFHFDTRLLTSKHIKLFSTYLVQRNNTMSKTCFSVPQNAKKNSAET